MKYVLALDLGTTGNRAIVFDQTQKVISSEYREFTQYFPKPGWVEHDAEEIWQSTVQILKKTFKRLKVSDIAALGITNQRETVVLWDKRTGKPVHRAIVWQCRRTASYCQKLKREGHEKWIHRKTGLFLDAYFSASKMNWLIQHAPGVRRGIQKGNILAGTVDSWILWKLTGGKVHGTDTSNASRTMLFDINKLRWDESLCRLFGVPMHTLPKVFPSSAVVAQTDPLLFGRLIPIAALVGDQQAAAFAQGCFQKGTIKNTYGTGLFMLENTGNAPRFSHNLLSTVAWSIGSLEKTSYAVEGSVFIGGAAIQWLRDGLKIIRKASEAEPLAKSLLSNDDVYFVPALVGLGAPYWDPDARGLLIGITRGTTRAHIARAALESIAFQSRDLLEVMKKDTYLKRLDRLRVDGGATANDFLMQLQADILRAPVERPVVLQTTALGAAALAGIAVGYWKNTDDFLKSRKVDRLFKPSLSPAAANKIYRRWKEAVRRSLSWNSASFTN